MIPRAPFVPRSSTGPARLGRGTPSDSAESLDLSGLKRIIKVDRRNRVAIVEAGVTFPELRAELDPAGLRALHPLLPLPGKSVVASCLDREPPLVPKYHWDSTDPLLCAELWFGTGECFRTGGAAGPGDTLEEQWAAGMHQKNPLGPAQTDLLKIVQGSQGTMGLATWASIRLELLPEITLDFLAGSDDAHAVAGFVHEMARRRIGDEILVLDAAATKYAGHAVGLDLEPRHTWTALVRIGSLPYHPLDSVEWQVADAKDLARLAGVELVQADRPLGAILGTPAEHAWKTPGTYRDVFFLATLDGGIELSSMVRDRWCSLGVEPARVSTYLQPLDQGRNCHVEVTAHFDAAHFDAAGSDEATAIDEDLVPLAGDLADAGAFFSRPSPPLARAVYDRCPDTVKALDLVKSVLDPENLMSPGRLWRQR